MKRILAATLVALALAGCSKEESTTVTPPAEAPAAAPAPAVEPMPAPAAEPAAPAAPADAAPAAPAAEEKK